MVQGLLKSSMWRPCAELQTLQDLKREWAAGHAGAMISFAQPEMADWRARRFEFGLVLAQARA
jgi:hypothetical protein